MRAVLAAMTCECGWTLAMRYPGNFLYCSNVNCEFYERDFHPPRMTLRERNNGTDEGAGVDIKEV